MRLSRSAGVTAATDASSTNARRIRGLPRVWPRIDRLAFKQPVRKRGEEVHEDGARTPTTRPACTGNEARPFAAATTTESIFAFFERSSQSGCRGMVVRRSERTQQPARRIDGPTAGKSTDAAK
jgi:hypothetical protein